MRSAIALLFMILLTSSCTGGGDGDSSFIQDGYIEESSVSVYFNPLAINRLNQESYEVSGTCTTGATLAITIQNLNLQASCPNGTFSLSTDISPLNDGLIDISVTASKGSKSAGIIKRVLKDSLNRITDISLEEGNYPLGSTLSLEVTFSSEVTITGAPRLSFQTADGLKNFTFQKIKPNSEGKIAIFTYQVLLNDIDQDGITLDQLNLSGGAIEVSETQADLDLSSLSLHLSNVNIDGLIPQLTFPQPQDINSHNQSNYSLSGTCNEEGEGINLSTSGLSLSTTCQSGTWTFSSVDMSSLPDSANLNLVVFHFDSAGNRSELISREILKDTSGPTVTLNTPTLIDNSNETSYQLSGTCSENTQIVALQIANLTFNPRCSSGQWNSGFLDLSSLSDSNSITLEVSHQSAPLVTATLSKDSTIPTVTFSSPQNITKETYSIGGTCSENSRQVDLLIGDLSFSTLCSNGTWYLRDADVSSLSDSSTLLMTANHSSADNRQANEATTQISKASNSPSVINLGTSDELTRSLRLSWNRLDQGQIISDTQIQYRSTLSTVWLTLDEAVTTEENILISDLAPDSEYAFRVRVSYNSIWSGYSTEVIARTKPDDPLFSPNKAMNVGGATSSRVVAYLDDTTVTLNGNHLVTLNKGETHLFASTQFDVIDADKPIFTAGKRGTNSTGNGGANMVWSPTGWAGKSFSFNSIRSNPQRLLVYPIEDGEITVKQGSTTLATSSLTKGVGVTLNWSVYGSYQVLSSANVLLYHYSAQSNRYVDPKPIMPSSFKIIGFPSSSMRLTADLDGTNYDLIHSNSDTAVNSLNKSSVVTVSPKGTSSLYQSHSLLIRSDKKISGASFADSNGYCAAPFLPTSFMKEAYVINANSDYVAFASTHPGTITILDSSDNVIQTLTLTRSGTNEDAPYRARITNQSAGTRYISTTPMAAWYQPNEYNGAMRSDETILFGADLP
ncbi:MAG: fibronectin type III domain-containing protein [Bdellovibrionota bacterium]|nr:fibronectin type III domain-containing protein [Bdellovibrionota bacterium]